MRVVLLGCHGFIGSHILKALSDQQVRVSGIDRYDTVSFWRKDIVPEGFKATCGDLVDDDIYTGNLEDADTIIFAAGNPIPANRSFDLLFGVELRIVIKLLEFLADRNPNARFIFISSGGTVYGERPEGTLCREDDLLEPISLYGVMKLSCEKSIEVYAQKHKLRATILRVANPYGPGQNPNAGQGLIPVVIKKLLAGQSLDIWGDGRTFRDYFFVEDLAQFIAMIVQKDHEGGIYNVGSGKGGVSALEIIDLAASATGCEPIIRFHPLRSQDLHWNALSIDKINQEFGWQPKVPIDKGIEITATCLKAQLTMIGE